jgi:hypothetical protein
LANRIHDHRVAVGQREIGGESRIRRNLIATALGIFAAARGKSEDACESKRHDIQETRPILHLNHLWNLAERSDWMLFSPP